MRKPPAILRGQLGVDKRPYRRDAPFFSGTGNPWTPPGPVSCGRPCAPRGDGGKGDAPWLDASRLAPLAGAGPAAPEQRNCRESGGRLRQALRKACPISSVMVQGALAAAELRAGDRRPGPPLAGNGRRRRSAKDREALREGSRYIGASPPPRTPTSPFSRCGSKGGQPKVAVRLRRGLEPPSPRPGGTAP
jgi:hypothetical protein